MPDMTVRTISYQTGLFTVLREIDFTLAQMEHEPLAASHLPAAEAEQARRAEVQAAEEFEAQAQALLAQAQALRGKR